MKTSTPKFLIGMISTLPTESVNSTYYNKNGKICIEPLQRLPSLRCNAR